ncbi:glycosyltransferase family 2 protein [Patescibacteria group bacterium]
MLAAVVLTKSEEGNIGDCLDCLSFCDEVLVVDDFSQDRTRKIATKKGAQVYKRKLEDDFAAQRNFALQKTKMDWVLFVDADERVSPGLREEILQVVKKSGDKVGFYLNREDHLFGKRIRFGEAGQIKLLRLAKRTGGKWARRVHEVWQVTGEIGSLDKPLKHYPHPTITSFLKEINYYSRLHALTAFEEGKKSSLVKMIGYPFAKFLQNYLLRLGFLDMMPGLILALMMSLHSFLSQGKLYLLEKESTT